MAKAKGKSAATKKANASFSFGGNRKSKGQSPAAAQKAAEHTAAYYKMRGG